LEEILELDLLERLDSEDLCELRKYFFFLDTESKKKAVHRKQQRQKKPKQIRGEDVQKYGGRPLKRKQFVKAIEEVVGKWRTIAAQVENLIMCRRWQFDT
jgi:hypothetical protein